MLMLFWTGLSAINAISLTMLGMGIYMMMKAFMVYLYILNKVTTKEQLRGLIKWLLAGLGFQGFLGLVQYTTGSSLGLELFGAISKQRMAGVTRVRGTIGYPNQFGAWLALQIPIAVSLFIFELRGSRKTYYGVAAVLGIFGLLLSFSRSAWAGLLGCGLVFVIIMARRRLLKPKYIITLGAAMVFLSVLVVVFWDTIVLRFETGDTGKYRMIMMEIAYDLIKENPVFGVGLHNYKFHQVELFRYWNPVHNEYMRLAAETGLPGLLFFLSVIWISLKECSALLRCRDRFIFAVALGSICSMWAFLFLINFGPEYAHYRIHFLFWILVAVMLSLRRIYYSTVDRYQKQNPSGQSGPMAAPRNGKIAPADIHTRGANR